MRAKGRTNVALSAVVVMSCVYLFHDYYEITPRGTETDQHKGTRLASQVRVETKSETITNGGDANDVKQNDVAAPVISAPRKSEFLKGLSDGDSFWMLCANQRGTCNCPGTIRWGRGGVGGKWKEYPETTPGKMQTLKCSVEVLPDILPGDDAKHCECEMKVGSDMYKKITNPGVLPSSAGADHSPLLVSSCDMVMGKSDLDWDRALRTAVEPFCSTTWPEPPDAASGDRALTMAEMQQSVLAWVDEEFVDARDRMYGDDGWLPRGFITYYAGPVDGKHAKMIEQLVISVHEFSQEPIVVVHFGTNTPTTWTSERFPRMIILHIGQLPPDAGRSLNFNKMRAMIIAKIKVGVQLDADQFVAPGVDALFDRTAAEVTKDYAFPILPSHFADRGPKDLGKYWDRYCPGDPEDKTRTCPWQTTRWSHAHPTWTYWALPFLGRWLRMNLRDETLPKIVRDSTTGIMGEMSELRITDVPEDEDLLNIGTWEEGGTKQWCKIDQVAPGEFDALVGGADAQGNCKEGWRCHDIIADAKFHPIGVAKAFYTAHHAVLPDDETPKYIKLLKDMHANKTLPPPVMFHGHFYADGAAVKKAFPDATCLL